MLNRKEVKQLDRKVVLVALLAVSLLAALAFRVQVLEREKAELATALQGLENELAALQGQLSGLQAELEALQAQHSELETQYAELQAEHEGLEAQYSELQTDYGELESAYSELEAAYEELQADYEEALEEIEDLKAQIPPEAPEFHPFSLLLKLHKNEMVSGALQNKGTKKATNVTVVLKILAGDVDKMELSDNELHITVSGEPSSVLFEFTAKVFEILDPKETNSWKLTWADASEKTKERFDFADVDQFRISGRVKVVVDLMCDEGVEEHWEFTFEL